MGNSAGANRMAVAAIANTVSMDRKELLGLQKHFKELAQRQGNPNTITREEFKEALALEGIAEADKEMLDRLFTMWDKTGSNSLYFKEFVVGLAPLCVGSAGDKIHFAFELFDMDGKKEISKSEMVTVLSSMNSTASYFGDVEMSKEDIQKLVDEVFAGADASKTGTLNYSEFIRAVEMHPILVQFVSGEEA